MVMYLSFILLYRGLTSQDIVDSEWHTVMFPSFAVSYRTSRSQVTSLTTEYASAHVEATQCYRDIDRIRGCPLGCTCLGIPSSG